jgi:hypothetical protein
LASPACPDVSSLFLLFIPQICPQHLPNETTLHTPLTHPRPAPPLVERLGETGRTGPGKEAGVVGQACEVTAQHRGFDLASAARI